VFLCGNMAGEMAGEMEKPVVIGKVKKPRCFKNLDICSLPVLWKHNKKGVDDGYSDNRMADKLQSENGKADMENHFVSR